MPGRGAAVHPSTQTHIFWKHTHWRSVHTGGFGKWASVPMLVGWAVTTHDLTKSTSSLTKANHHQLAEFTSLCSARFRSSNAASDSKRIWDIWGMINLISLRHFTLLNEPIHLLIYCFNVKPKDKKKHLVSPWLNMQSFNPRALPSPTGRRVSGK